MKRTIAIFALLAIAISLTACASPAQLLESQAKAKDHICKNKPAANRSMRDDDANCAYSGNVANDNDYQSIKPDSVIRR